MPPSVKPANLSRLPAVLVLLAGSVILYGATAEFYNVASGTGAWIGDLSFKWAIAFALFALFCVSCLAAGVLAIWNPRPWVESLNRLAAARNRLGAWRLLIAGIILVLPVWFLQYSPWGVVFSRIYGRLLIWGVCTLLAGFLFSREGNRPLSWSAMIVALLLSGALFALATPFMGVTGYPFSLNWSEGNRLWDYSLLFASSLYSFAPGSHPSAYLDLGRQIAGGLPFLLPHVSIVGERLWLAAASILPYLLLGGAIFWPDDLRQERAWMLAGVWGFLFLSQGPIHTPLLVVAVLVAVAWRLPRWPAALLVVIAAYIAEVSRFTWIFAPSMWAVMLEFGGAKLEDGTIPRSVWERSITLALAGLLGGGIAVLGGLAPGAVGITASAAASTKQPLLWYRLLPNATYGSGILLGLLLASGPLILIMLLLAVRHWRRVLLQRLAIVLPLLAFLVVGLIVSTKIGGGGDLHNLDMFLIGLLLLAGMLWRAGGAGWLMHDLDGSAWIRILTVALIAIPAFQPLMEMRPISFANDLSWLTVLADVPRARDLGSLPSDAEVASSLQSLRQAVSEAQKSGPVLFLDQRQLLTFGYITNVELVPEYEKKLMMDEALSANATYFQPYYQDLAAHRFSLIISSPLRTPIKDSEYGFGEENNAWVKWIAKPTLCYYTELDTLTDVKVELLVPQTTPTDCSAALP